MGAQPPQTTSDGLFMAENLPQISAPRMNIRNFPKPPEDLYQYPTHQNASQNRQNAPERNWNAPERKSKQAEHNWNASAFATKTGRRRMPRMLVILLLQHPQAMKILIYLFHKVK